MGLEFTEHARHTIVEGGIEQEWVMRTVGQPELVRDRPDGTRHFMLRIPERSGRVLRLVVNASTEPWRVVTAFFDRTMKGRMP